MNTPLRFNEALLIADRAFRPFQCVAWAPQDGTGVVSISVIVSFERRYHHHFLLRQRPSAAEISRYQQVHGVVVPANAS